MAHMQRKLSPGLIFGAAVTCGTFAALATHILLRGAGIELVAMWRHLAPSNAAEMKAALAWWATAGAALAASWIAVVVLRRQPIARRRARILRWLLGAGAGRRVGGHRPFGRGFGKRRGHAQGRRKLCRPRAGRNHGVVRHALRHEALSKIDGEPSGAVAGCLPNGQDRPHCLAAGAARSRTSGSPRADGCRSRARRCRPKAISR